MNKILLLSFLAFTAVACNSDSHETKEKVLLQKEIELLKKENELLIKDSLQKQTQIETPNIKKYFDDNDCLISNKTAGKFVIGNPLPSPGTSNKYSVEVKNQIRNTEEGPEEETIYKVNENSTTILELRPSYNYETGNYEKKIGEIMILSPKFKTKKGIGINSTIQEFINAYPDYKVWYTYVGEMYVIQSRSSNTQFLLQEKDFIGKLNITSDQMILNKNDFKPAAKIYTIRLYDDYD